MRAVGSCWLLAVSGVVCGGTAAVPGTTAGAGDDISRRHRRRRRRRSRRSARPESRPPRSRSPTTHRATTTAVAAPASPAPAPATTTPASECEALDGTEAFNDGFPMRSRAWSAATSAPVRTVLRTRRDRVRRTGDPGVRVEYVDDPVHLSPSDETVEIDGDATLVISVAAWMPSMEGDGYAGPSRLQPHQRRAHPAVASDRELRGHVGVGDRARQRARLRGDFLESPARIVVDIATE